MTFTGQRWSPLKDGLWVAWIAACFIFAFVGGRTFAYVLIGSFAVLEASGLRHAHDADPTLTAEIRRRVSPWLSHVVLGAGLVRLIQLGFAPVLVGALAGFCVWHFDPEYDAENDT